MHVRVMDKYGRTITVCEMAELRGMVEGLVIKHDRILVERCVTPKIRPLVPEDLPFSTPPTLCVISQDEFRVEFYHMTLDIPIHIRGGGTQNIIVNITSELDIEKIGRALRKEIHRNIPLTESALDNYKDWYEQTVADLVSSAIDDIQQGEEND